MLRLLACALVETNEAVTLKVDRPIEAGESLDTISALYLGYSRIETLMTGGGHRAVADRHEGGMGRMITLYAGAALAEIAGCFAFWAWLRLGRSGWWLLPGIASLVAFAWLLTRADAAAAGRAYAAYGGVYIVASLLWLWLVEGSAPDRWDLGGAALCLVGAGIILFGPRAA